MTKRKDEDPEEMKAAFIIVADALDRFSPEQVIRILRAVACLHGVDLAAVDLAAVVGMKEIE